MSDRPGITSLFSRGLKRVDVAVGTLVPDQILAPRGPEELSYADEANIKWMVTVAKQVEKLTKAQTTLAKIAQVGNNGDPGVALLLEQQKAACEKDAKEAMTYLKPLHEAMVKEGLDGFADIFPPAPTPTQS